MTLSKKGQAFSPDSVRFPTVTRRPYGSFFVSSYYFSFFLFLRYHVVLRLVCEMCGFFLLLFKFLTLCDFRRI